MFASPSNSQARETPNTQLSRQFSSVLSTWHMKNTDEDLGFIYKKKKCLKTNPSCCLLRRKPGQTEGDQGESTPGPPPSRKKGPVHRASRQAEQDTLQSPPKGLSNSRICQKILKTGPGLSSPTSAVQAASSSAFTSLLGPAGPAPLPHPKNLSQVLLLWIPNKLPSPKAWEERRWGTWGYAGCR